MDEVLGLLQDNREHINASVLSLRSGLENLDKNLAEAQREGLMSALANAGRSVSQTLAGVDEQIARMSEREMMDGLADIVDNVNAITAAVNQPENLESILRNIDLLAANLNDLAIRAQQSWPKLELFVDDLAVAARSAQEMMSSGKQLLVDAQEYMRPVFEGEGSLSRFLRDDGFFLQVQAILSKADTLMNDMNHYGILYHLNRGWKRERTLRANTLAGLQRPSDFRNYFETELDTINTSVARVAMMMSEAEDVGQRDRLVTNDAFARAFADLLRRVNTLSDNIALYNQSLVPEQ